MLAPLAQLHCVSPPPPPPPPPPPRDTTTHTRPLFRPLSTHGDASSPGGASSSRFQPIHSPVQLTTGFNPAKASSRTPPLQRSSSTGGRISSHDRASHTTGAGSPAAAASGGSCGGGAGAASPSPSPSTSHMARLHARKRRPGSAPTVPRRHRGTGHAFLVNGGGQGAGDAAAAAAAAAAAGAGADADADGGSTPAPSPGQVPSVVDRNDSDLAQARTTLFWRGAARHGIDPRLVRTQGPGPQQVSPSVSLIKCVHSTTRRTRRTHARAHTHARAYTPVTLDTRMRACGCVAWASRCIVWCVLLLFCPSAPCRRRCCVGLILFLVVVCVCVSHVPYVPCVPCGPCAAGAASPVARGARAQRHGA